MSSSLDPRIWVTRWPRVTIALFVLATLLMGYGNVIAKKGGVLDDPILDADNPFRVSDRYVRGKRAEGFQGQEFIPFILRFDDGISTPADLERVREFTDRVKARFGQSVLSLSEVPDYRDTGDELLNFPHIPGEIPEGFDMGAWKARVAKDPMVYGLLVGRDFDWAAVARYLPPDYDEIGEFRATAAFLEDREISELEWLYKTDIETEPSVGVGGGVIMRGLLDQGLNVDTFKLVTIGVLLAMPLFIWSLGSLREALIGVGGVVLLGLLWTRGSIGLLDFMGFEIRERVYTLLAYTNCIVQGVSFVLHKFESFHEVYRGDDLNSHWARSRTNDHLIGATGLIAIFGFATLYTFEVLSIRELGVLSAFAVAYQLILVLLLVPALHVLVSHGRPYTPPRTGSKGAETFAAVLDWVAERATRLVTWGAPGATAWWAGVATIGVVILAGLLVWPGGFLIVKTAPFNFIRGTVVARTGDFLNEPGRSGRDLLQLLAEPANSDDIYDPTFLDALRRYQERLKSDTDIREIASIVNQVQRVSEESFGTTLPQTRQEARAAFSLVEADLDTAVARQLFYVGGVRMTAYFHSLDSRHTAGVLDRMLEIAAEDFGDLKISTFGKSGKYPQLDDYVAVGKPVNMLVSEVIVVLFCWIGVALNNRRKVAGRPFLRSFPGGVIMSVPFFFASALMTLLMMAIGIPLDIATAAITPLAINASIDFSIYYADAYQHGLAESGNHAAAVRYAMHHKGRVVLEDMLLNAVCFLPLMSSRFDPVQETGWMMAIMLMACAFGTLVLMPMLFYGFIDTAPTTAD